MIVLRERKRNGYRLINASTIVNVLWFESNRIMGNVSD